MYTFWIIGDKLLYKEGLEKLYLFISDRSNNVKSSMFECSKAKIGVRVQLPRDEHVQCQLDVQRTVRGTFSEHHIGLRYVVSRNISMFFTWYQLQRSDLINLSFQSMKKVTESLRKIYFLIKLNVQSSFEVQMFSDYRGRVVCWLDACLCLRWWKVVREL